MTKIERRVVYIPGLGGRYDRLRKIGLWTWRFRLGVVAELVPMRWEDERDSVEQKYLRAKTAVEREPGKKCIVVAESAGGAIGVRLAAELPEYIERLVTVCGKNRGASSINSAYQQRFPELVKAVERAEKAFASLSQVKKGKFFCLYSPGDKLLSSRDTTLPGCRRASVGTAGHGRTIWGLLILLNSKVFRASLTGKDGR